jgi:hypothetical protein
MTPGTLKVRVVDLTLFSSFDGWHLRNKAKITVNVLKLGYIGRVYIFAAVR